MIALLKIVALLKLVAVLKIVLWTCSYKPWISVWAIAVWGRFEPQKALKKIIIQINIQIQLPYTFDFDCRRHPPAINTLSWGWIFNLLFHTNNLESIQRVRSTRIVSCTLNKQRVQCVANRWCDKGRRWLVLCLEVREPERHVTKLARDVTSAARSQLSDKNITSCVNSTQKPRQETIVIRFYCGSRVLQLRSKFWYSDEANSGSKENWTVNRVRVVVVHVEFEFHTSIV